MSTIEASIGQLVKVPFISKTLATGQAGSYALKVIRDGVLTTIGSSAVFSEIGNGVYSVAISFPQAGDYYLIADDQIISIVLVSETTTRSMISAILDGTLGSWRWDKVSGSYTLYGIGGQVVATYNIEDTVQLTSRQRTS